MQVVENVMNKPVCIWWSKKNIVLHFVCKTKEGETVYGKPEAIVTTWEIPFHSIDSYFPNSLEHASLGIRFSVVAMCLYAKAHEICIDFSTKNIEQ